jgi:hypothetical protein
MLERLRTATQPGVVIVVEDIEVGFVAFVCNDGIRVTTRSPYLVQRWGGARERFLSNAEWPVFVRELCAQALPIGITKGVYHPTAEIGDALGHAPGAYILKPRYGSNGFSVARVVSQPDGWLTVASDCPDTAGYLAEFPADPGQRGRDLVTAAARDRGRFADRARVGLSEQMLSASILEEEIRQDRVEGALFEPRIVVQRVRPGQGETFTVLGAICKRIETAIGACVARDFHEEPLEVSLHRFLQGQVSQGDLIQTVCKTQAEILAAGDRLCATLVPALAARGARIHQFGIDCRLCWDPHLERVTYPFLEVQFGIGRIAGTPGGGPPFTGCQTATELRARFGPEVG